MKYIFTQTQIEDDYNIYAADVTTLSKTTDNIPTLIPLFCDFLLACTFSEEQVRSALIDYVRNELNADPYNGN